MNNYPAEYIDIETEILAAAGRAHAGQKRRDGSNYIMHPARVAKSAISFLEKQYANENLYETRLVTACTAFLHDVLEDTDYRVTDLYIILSDAGICKESVDIILEACQLLSKDKNTKTYEDYMHRIISNETYAGKIAVLVKYFDMLDNMTGCFQEISCGEATKKNVRQLQKYLLYIEDFKEKVYG